MGDKRMVFWSMGIPPGIEQTAHLAKQSSATLCPGSALATALAQGDSGWHVDSLEPSLGTQW